MAAGSEILREYLVALGFSVNPAGQKKFDDSVKNTEKLMNGLAKTLGAATAAVAAYVAVYSTQMEKLYYASQRIGASAGNIKALEYGGRQIGITGDQMRGALEGIARTIRSNPGLLGLLDRLGVAHEGRDMADVAKDLVKTLNTMPTYVAERFGQLFGIDPDTLFMMRQGMADLEAYEAKRKQMASDLGIDMDQLAKDGKEFSQSWREIVEYGGMFMDVLMSAANGPLKDMSRVTKEIMQDWISIIQNWRGMEDFMTRMAEGLGIKSVGGGVRLTPEAAARAGTTQGGAPLTPAPTAAPQKRGFWDWLTGDPLSRYRNGPKPQQGAQNPQQGPAGATPAPTEPSSYLGALERKYSLPAGILDKVWKTESNRGDPRFMLSPKGAQGHFGFMPKTAREYDLKDPNDFAASADASARMWADLLKRYDGDVRKAAAAYNWGLGNVERQGLGAAPAETRNYMDKIGGAAPAPVTITGGHTEYNIYGATNPEAVAQEIQRSQQNISADLFRQYERKVK